MSPPALSPSEIARHAELLENRVAKNYRHLKKRFERQGIGAYRLYDWDIPEVRARVDYYEGHLVVSEYERAQTLEVDEYLPALGGAAARAVACPQHWVHLKRRRTRPSRGPRYERLSRDGERLIVRERQLRFWVNLDDFVDTGLFADHRDTRQWLAEQVRGKSFLNLYCYTGSFTCAAAGGGARATTSVDLSGRYLDWTRDNMELNAASAENTAHEFATSDVGEFLLGASRQGRHWDVLFVDPPSFSTVGGGQGGAFDVLRDHPQLLRRALDCTAAGGLLVFSTNHQRFEPHFDGLRARIEEITHRTVPEDYRNRYVHRCFVLRKNE